VHLQWHVRPDDATSAAAAARDDPSCASAPPEHDTVVFAGEARFEPLAKGPPRVFALKFAAEKDRNLYFWMQEPDAGGDAARGARVDALINAPMAMDEDDRQEGAGGAGGGAGAAGGAAQGKEDAADPWPTPADALTRAHESGATGAGTEYVAGDSVGLMPSGPGQGAAVFDGAAAGGGGDGGGRGDAAAALAALLSGIGGSAGVGSGGGMMGGAPPSSTSDPGNALAQALAAALARSGHGGLQQQQQQQVDPGPSLLDVLRPDAVAAALGEDGPARLAEAAERLAEFLPEGEGQRGAQGLLDNVRSPQFRAQVASLAHALQTGQLDLATFGLSGARGYSMRDFVDALQGLVKREKEEDEKGGGGGGGGGGGEGQQEPPPPPPPPGNNAGG
jgi:hypothetical protein